MKKQFLVFAMACLSLAAVNVQANEYQAIDTLGPTKEEFKDSLLCGDSLEFVATPDTGYRFVKWDGFAKDEEGNLKNEHSFRGDAKDTLVMPFFQASDTTIKAVFTLQNYNLRIDAQCINGSTDYLGNRQININVVHAKPENEEEPYNDGFKPADTAKWVNQKNTIFHKDTITISTGDYKNDCYEFVAWYDATDTTKAPIFVTSDKTYKFDIYASDKYFIAVYQKRPYEVRAYVEKGKDGNSHGTIEAVVYRKYDEE